MKTERQTREHRGRQAETLAVLWIRMKGYRVLARRYRTPHGEIDIIARKRQVLAIIEVKRRLTVQAAYESINTRTRQRIIRTAHLYIAHHPWAARLARRYDGIFLVGQFRIIHRPDLWRE